MNPRTEATAYRIWAFAKDRGWDVTAGEIAEALGITPQAVGHVCRIKGWGTRLRKTDQSHRPGGPGRGVGLFTDYALSGTDIPAIRAHYAQLAAET